MCNLSNSQTGCQVEFQLGARLWCSVYRLTKGARAPAQAKGRAGARPGRGRARPGVVPTALDSARTAKRKTRPQVDDSRSLYAVSPATTFGSASPDQGCRSVLVCDGCANRLRGACSCVRV